MISKQLNRLPLLVSTFLFVLFTFTALPVFSADELTHDETKTAAATTSKFSVSSDSSPINTGRMTQLVLGLFIVLLCILALAWLARRFNRLQSTPDGSLRLLGGLSMGARERIVLIQVGTEQLLLGVSPGRINTLHVLTEPLDSMSGTSPLSTDKGFAEKLSAAITRNK